MKKIVLLLIAFTAISIMSPHEVKAETGSFYEAEFLDNIYTRRSLNTTVYYQRSRFFRERGTGKVAYCIEPFTGFSTGLDFIPTDTFDNLNEEALLKMSLLANYGYLYPGHEDIKWYVITQQLIWQVAQPNGIYEFTNGLDGTTIYPYENEIAELWNLVNHHLTQPSFHNQEINVVENQKITLTDMNQVLEKYQSNDSNIIINNNNLTIKDLKEGTYSFQLTKSSNTHDSPALFYYSPSGQDIMTIGNAKDLKANFTINVKKTSLEITKIDKDTNSITPSGEGVLIGTKYGLYDNNNKLIQELIIDKNNKAKVENIPYGFYILKELETKEGYLLDSKEYSIEINQEKTKIELTLINEIIKKKVQIHKEFGTEENTHPEQNIIFDIYNNNNELISSITTDENGYAEIILPYGSYIIKQRNTTKDYKKVEDFAVVITDKDQNLNYQLYDYKIEVPNTKKNAPHPLYIILLNSLGGIYVLLQGKNL